MPEPCRHWYERTGVVCDLPDGHGRTHQAPNQTWTEDSRYDRVGPHEDPLSAYDLRLRSLDMPPGEPHPTCSTCDRRADWSIWMHTPDWPPKGGMTRVLCTAHALESISFESHIAMKISPNETEAAIIRSLRAENLRLHGVLNQIRDLAEKE